MSYVVLNGGLVTDVELQRSKKGNAYASFTIAVNYTPRNEDGSWGEQVTSFQRVAVFGRKAELLAASNLPKGTPLFVSGYYRPVERPGFTTKAGVEVEPSVEMQVVVDTVGVEVRSNKVSSEFVKRQEGEPRQGVARAKSAPAAKSSPGVSEELFSDDDLFGSSDEDDIFA